MAHTLLAALEQDFALHGQDAITTLRTEKPQTWARLVAEICQFRLLPKTPKPAPRREPRPLRMKALIGEMQAPPTLDLDDPALPPDRMEELLRVTGE